MDDVSSVLLETCVLAADIGLTYLFYSLYKRRCVAANTIKVRNLVSLTLLSELLLVLLLVLVIILTVTLTVTYTVTTLILNLT